MIKGVYQYVLYRCVRYIIFQELKMKFFDIILSVQTWQSSSLQATKDGLPIQRRAVKNNQNVFKLTILSSHPLFFAFFKHSQFFFPPSLQCLCIKENHYANFFSHAPVLLFLRYCTISLRTWVVRNMPENAKVPYKCI